MKKKLFLKISAVLLAMLMVLGVATSCASNVDGEQSSEIESSVVESETDESTTVTASSETESTETESAEITSSETESSETESSETASSETEASEPISSETESSETESSEIESSETESSETESSETESSETESSETESSETESSETETSEATSSEPETETETETNTIFGDEVEYATNFTVSKVFDSNMVVQRNEYVRVWGWADESENGKKISASFMGYVAETLVENGEWEIVFRQKFAANASLGNHLVVYTEENDYIFEDILIGDVFMVIGQSNVQYNVGTYLNNEPDLKWTKELLKEDTIIRYNYNSNTQREGYPTIGTDEQ